LEKGSTEGSKGKEGFSRIQAPGGGQLALGVFVMRSTGKCAKREWTPLLGDSLEGVRSVGAVKWC
jgi:hypothetical protein